MKVFWDIKQGTEEWIDARSGIPTASAASKLLSQGQGKTRRDYMYQIIGEIMTGKACKTWQGNHHTERGHEMEPEAGRLYQLRTGYDLKKCGFIRNHESIGGAGYSPDGLILDDGCVEIKSRLPHIQAELLDTRKIPTDAIKQIQFGLWVSERQWCDYVSYWPGMPLFVDTVYRDYDMIQKIEIEAEKFNTEIRQKLGKITGIQKWQVEV